MTSSHPADKVTFTTRTPKHKDQSLQPKLDHRLSMVLDVLRREPFSDFVAEEALKQKIDLWQVQGFIDRAFDFHFPH